MGSDNAEFETFMNKYQLYKVNNWNDLSVWENPLEKWTKNSHIYSAARIG